MSLFSTGIFPVSLTEYDLEFRDELLDIKVHPEKYTKEQLNERTDKPIQILKLPMTIEE